MIQVWLKNKGLVVGYMNKYYYFRIDSETSKILFHREFGFSISMGKHLFIRTFLYLSLLVILHIVHSCLDPNLLVLSSDETDTHKLSIVWDVEKDEEVSNLSYNNFIKYINGPSSKAGYLILNDCYVNLDNGLKNYFYEIDFGILYSYSDTKGYSISLNDENILWKRTLLTKETLVEVASVDEYLDPTKPLNINSRNINLERIRFQVDTNTALHFFALDSDRLALILDYMEEHKPGYLTAILMRNNKGKTPLDLAIDGMSPRNTEMLLKKLLLFADQSLSNLFFDRFNDLLKMNIKAFSLYLNSCYFETIQMKTMKHLQFKKKSYPLLLPHTCCVINKQFIEEH